MKKIEQEGERKGRQKQKTTEQRLATLKILKLGDDNELERNLRLEKSKQLRSAVEMEEERRARVENDVATKCSGWPWRRTK